MVNFLSQVTSSSNTAPLKAILFSYTISCFSFTQMSSEPGHSHKRTSTKRPLDSSIKFRLGCCVTVRTKGFVRRNVHMWHQRWAHDVLCWFCCAHVVRSRILHYPGAFQNWEITHVDLNTSTNRNIMPTETLMLFVNSDRKLFIGISNCHSSPNFSAIKSMCHQRNESKPIPVNPHVIRCQRK